MGRVIPLIDTATGTQIFEANTGAQRSSVSGIDALGKYDDYLRPEINQEANRGFNQSAMDKFAKGFLSRGASVITKTGQGIGHVGGALAYLGDLVTPGEANPNVIWDNAWVDAFAEADEALKEALPVHKQRQYQDGNIVSKLATADFWAEDFFDGLAFLGSAMIPGVGFGKIAGAAKSAITATEKGVKLANALKGKATAFTRGFSTAYNTVSEAGFEAKETFDTLTKEYQGKVNPDTGDFYNEHEAKQKAGEAAARVFGANAVGLIAPNYIQSKWFHKGSNQVAKELRHAVRTSEDAGKAIKGTISSKKELATGILSEGFWEENFQTALSQYESEYAKGVVDLDWLSAVGSNMAGNAKGALKVFNPFNPPEAHSKEDEGATAIILGSIIGGGASTISSFKDKRKEAEDIKREVSNWERVKNIHDVAKNIYVENSLAGLKVMSEEPILDEEGNPTGETKKTYINDKGEVSLESDKTRKNVLRNAKDKSIFEMAALSAIAGNKFMYEYNHQNAIASYAYHLKTANLSEEDINDLIKYDFSFEDSRVDNAESIRVNETQLRDYMKIYDNIATENSSIEDFSDLKEDEVFNSILRRTRYHLASQISNLNNVKKLSANEKFIESVDAKIESLTKDLDLTKNKEQIKKEYTDTINVVRNNRNRITELTEKLATSPDNATELQEEIDVLDYQNEEIKQTKGYFYHQAFAPEYFSDYFSGAGDILSANRKLSLREKHLSHHAYNGMLRQEIDDDLQEGRDIGEIIDKYNTHSKFREPSIEAKLRKEADEGFHITKPKLEEELLATQDAYSKTVNLEQSIDIAQDEDEVQEALDFNVNQQYLDTLQNNGIVGIDNVTTQFDFVRDTLQKRINELQSEVEKASDAFKKSEKFDNKETAIPLEDLNDELPRLYYLERTDKFRKAIDTFKKDPDHIDTGIPSYLAFLEKIKKIYTAREDLKPSIKSFILKDIDRLIKGLLEAKKVSDKNGASREAEQRMALEERRKSLLKAVSLVIGEEVDEDMSYEEIVVTIHGEDKDKDLLDKIEKLQITLSKELLEHVRATQPHRDLPGGFLEPAGKFKPDYILNPAEGIFDVITSALKPRGESPIVREDDGSLSTYNRYRITKDFNEFKILTEMSNYKDFSAEERKRLEGIFEIHSKVAGLDIVRDINSSDVELSKLISEEFTALNKEIKKSGKKKVYPSTQQIIAIRELVTFLASSDKQILLKGIFGSGKTKVVMKNALALAEKLGLVAKADVMATGHTSESKTIIADSIDATAISSEDIIQGKLKGKLLVIDEVFAYTNVELQQILDAAKAKNIQVIALGDPSQVTVENNPLANKIRRRTQTLTSILRTNVSSIATLAKTYQYNEQPVEGITEGSTTLEDFSKDSIGTYTGDRALLKELVQKNPTVKKLLIVNHVEDIERYKDLQGVPNLVITTYDKAQGNQAEEVYIDMSTAGKNLKGVAFADNLEFNAAMATSISRGERMVYITSNVGISLQAIAPNPGIVENFDALSQEIEKNKDSYLESLSKFKALLDGVEFTEAKEETQEAVEEEENTPPTPENQEHENEPEVLEDDVEEEQEETKEPEVPIIPDPLGENSQHMLFPMSKWLVPSGPEQKGFKLGAPVKIVKLRVVGKPPIWVAMTPVSSESWGIIGTISREDTKEGIFSELPELAKTIKKPLGTLSMYREYTPEEVERHSFQEYTLKHANSMTIKYDNPPTTQSTAGLVETILRGFYTTEQWENLPDERKNPKYFVTGFRTKQIANAEGYEQLVKPGMPYLVIKSPWGEGSRDLLIRMNPPRLNSNSKWVAPIRKFADAIVVLSEDQGVSPDEYFNNKDFVKIVGDYAAIHEPDINQGQFGMKLRKDVDLNAWADNQGIGRDALAALDTIVSSIYSVQEINKIVTKEEFAKMHASDPKAFPLESFLPFKDGKKGHVSQDVNGQPQLLSALGLKRNTYGSESRGALGSAVRAWRRLARTNGTISGENVRVEKNGNIEPKALVEDRSADKRYPALLKTHLGRLRKNLRAFIKANPQIPLPEKTVLEKDIFRIGKALGIKEGETREMFADGKELNQVQAMEALSMEFSKTEILVKLGALSPAQLKDMVNELIAKPISFQQLMYLSGQNSFDENGNHVGIEKKDMYMLEPITFSDHSSNQHAIDPSYPVVISINGKHIKTTEDIDNSNLTTRFSSSKPSQVILTTGQGSAVVTPEIDNSGRTSEEEELLSTKLGIPLEDVQKMSHDEFEAMFRLADSSNFTPAETVFPDTVPGKLISKAEVIAFLKKVLPNYTGENSSIVEFLTHIDNSNQSNPNIDVWGRVGAGIMQLQQFENGQVPDQVLRHEVFHYIYKYALNTKTKILLNKSVAKHLDKLGLETNDMEEALAELYQRGSVSEEYRNSLPFTIKKFLNDILEFFGLVFDNKVYLDTLFYNIDKGKYSTAQVDLSNQSSSDIQFIRKYFADSIENYKEAKAYLVRQMMNMQEKGVRLKNGAGFILVTKQESIQRLESEAQLQYKMLSQFRPDDPMLKVYGTLLSSSRGNRLVLHDMIDTIYPDITRDLTDDEFAFDYEIDPENIDVEDINAKLLNITTDGLRKEIQNVATVNPEKGQSTALKDFLSFIKHPNREGAINSRYAFIKASRLIDQLDLNGEEFAKQIEELAEKEKDNPLSIAIINKISDVYIKATEPLDNRGTESTNFTMTSLQQDVTGAVSYFIWVDTSGEIDLRNRTFEELELLRSTNPHLQLIGTKDSTLSSLYVNANSQFPILPEDFNQTFVNLESRNALRDMMNNLGSMKETNYRIVTRKQKFGIVDIGYPEARSSTSRLTVKNEILNGIRTAVENRSISASDANGIMEIVKATPNAGLRLFLTKYLNLPHLSKAVTNARFVKDEILELVKSIKDIPETGKPIKENGEFVVDFNSNNEPVKRTTDPIEDWADKQSSRLSKIVQNISPNLETNRATSIVGGGGKKIYTRHMASFANKVLRHVQSMYQKGGDKWRKLPSYLNTEYFSHNIFLGKDRLNRIRDVYDHESYRNVFASGDSITDWLLQGDKEFYNQTFSAGFLRGNKDGYFQLLFQQEDKPRPVGLEVNILAPAKISVPAKEIENLVRTQIPEDFKKYEELKAKDRDILEDSRYRTLRKKISEQRKIAFAELAKDKTPTDQIKLALIAAIKQYAGQPDMSDKIHKFRKNLDTFNILEQASKTTGLDITEENADKLADEMLDLLTSHAIDVARQMIKSEIEIPSNFKESSFNHITGQGIEGNLFMSRIEKVYKEKTGKDFKAKAFNRSDGKIISKKKKDYLNTVEHLLPFVDLWVKNNYVNSYFGSQIVFGNPSYYLNSGMQIKRAGGPFAPGMMPLIGELVGGMKRTFRAAIIGDTEVSFDSVQDILLKIKYNKPLDQLTEEELRDYEELKALFPKESFEKTDAQAFMTPERFADLRKGYGRGLKLSTLMKPVYFGYRTEEVGGKQESIPTYLKNSTIVITDDLAIRFPELGRIRAQMRNNKIDELHFGSGTKLGRPKQLTSLDSFMDPEVDSNNNVLTLDNANYRIQLNPRSKVDKQVSIPTQLMYFINVLNKNPKESREIYGMLSLIIEDGLMDFGDKSKNFRRFLSSKFNNSTDFRFFDILAEGISHQNPLIEKKAIIQLGSLLEKMTVGLKFPGGKTNVQSAIGSDVVIDPSTGEMLRDKPLEYFIDRKNGNALHSEAIIPKGLLPEWQEKKVLAGEPIYVNGDVLGFRIPSTELHSALSIKVVGVYDSKGTNSIIVPQLVMAISGHDHDGDSIFLIKRPQYKKDIKFLTSDSSKFATSPFIIGGAKGDIIGFNKDGTKTKGFEQKIIDQIKLHKKIISNTNIDKFFRDDVKRNLNDLKKIRKDFYLGRIVDTMLDLVASPQNHNRVLAPINKGIWDPIIESVQEASGELPQPVDLASPLGARQALKNVADGSILIGVDANAIKDVAYMIKSGVTTEANSSVKKIFEIANNVVDLDEAADPIETEKDIAIEEAKVFDEAKNNPTEPSISTEFDPIRLNIGTTYGMDENGNEYPIPVISTFDKINQEEAGSGDNVWNTLASMVNIAIDNAKDQILVKINATINTGPAYMALLSLGYPKQTAVYLMTQPVIKKILDGKGKLSTTKMISAIGTELESIRKTLKDMGVDNLNDRREDHILSDDKLLSLFSESPKRPEGELTEQEEALYRKNEISRLLYTEQVLLTFKTSVKLGDALTKMSRFLGIVRSQPVVVEDLESILANFSEIFGIHESHFDYEVTPDSTLEEYLEAQEGRKLLANTEDFAYNIPLFFHQNPHIASSIRATLALKKKLEQHFDIHTEEFKSYMDSLKLPQVSLDGNKTEVGLRREVVKYLMSRIFKDEIRGATASVKTLKGKSIEVSGSKAWSENWIKRLEAVMNFDRLKQDDDYAGNHFLNNMFVKKSGAFSVVSFSNASNLVAEDFIEFEKAFKDLNRYDVSEVDGKLVAKEVAYNPDAYTDFQKEFVTYAALRFGFNFATSNFAAVLPIDLYADFSKQLDAEIKNFAGKDSTLRDMARDHLKLNLMIENVKGVRSFVQSESKAIKYGNTNKSMAIVTMEGKDTPVYSDLSYPNEYKDKDSDTGFETEFPYYIVRSETLYRRISESSDKLVNYQALGKTDDYGYDAFDSDTDYSMADRFDPRILTLTVASTNTNQVSSIRDLSKELENGTIIRIVSKFDRSRQFPVTVRLVEEESKDGDFFNYTVIPVEDIPLTQISHLKQESDYFQIKDSNGTHYLEVVGDVIRTASTQLKRFEGKKINDMRNYLDLNKGSIELLEKDCN